MGRWEIANKSIEWNVGFNIRGGFKNADDALIFIKFGLLKDFNEVELIVLVEEDFDIFEEMT